MKNGAAEARRLWSAPAALSCVWSLHLSLLSLSPSYHIADTSLLLWLFFSPSLPWPCFLVFLSPRFLVVLDNWSIGPFSSSVYIHLPNPVFVHHYHHGACWSIKYQRTIVQVCSPGHRSASCSLAVAIRLLWVTSVMHTFGRLFTAIVVCI